MGSSDVIAAVRYADMKSLLSLLLFCFLISLLLFSLNSSPGSHLHHYPSHSQIIISQLGPVVRRSFHGLGSAAYLFVHMGAYRGGPATFAVVGLGSKPLHVYANPSFHCQWLPHNATTPSAAAPGVAFLPDWGYGRVYTALVVNCTFPSPVGADGSGGRLLLREAAAEVAEVSMVAMEEAPGVVNGSLFTAPPRYECVYCGSPLYGDLSPQRVREWVAYHARLFGERSHMVLHDAGGVHAGVMKVLRPWIDKGTVSLQDVRGQERFDGYYHNQFVVVNDCLFRHKLVARWVFFFDVDEFMYVDPKTTLAALLASLSNCTQFSIEQQTMSRSLCAAVSSEGAWGMEKLVYRKLKSMSQKEWDRKYAMQPRGALTAGVHLSQNVVGESCHNTEGLIRYFHYHGSVAVRGDPCRELANGSKVKVDEMRFVRDETLRELGGAIRQFEHKNIGSLLHDTLE